MSYLYPLGSACNTTLDCIRRVPNSGCLQQQCFCFPGYTGSNCNDQLRMSFGVLVVIFYGFAMILSLYNLYRIGFFSKTIRTYTLWLMVASCLPNMIQRSVSLGLLTVKMTLPPVWIATLQSIGDVTHVNALFLLFLFFVELTSKRMTAVAQLNRTKPIFVANTLGLVALAIYSIATLNTFAYTVFFTVYLFLISIGFQYLCFLLKRDMNKLSTHRQAKTSKINTLSLSVSITTMVLVTMLVAMLSFNTVTTTPGVAFFYLVRMAAAANLFTIALVFRPTEKMVSKLGSTTQISSGDNDRRTKANRANEAAAAGASVGASLQSSGGEYTDEEAGADIKLKEGEAPQKQRKPMVTIKSMSFTDPSRIGQPTSPARIGYTLTATAAAPQSFESIGSPDDQDTNSLESMLQRDSTEGLDPADDVRNGASIESNRM